MLSNKMWDDRRVYIVGGGPSLIGFDFDKLRSRGYVVGVNVAMFRAPCDAGVSSDHLFIKKFYNALIIFAQQAQLYLALGEHWRNDLPEIPGAIYVQNGKDIRKGATSGHSALEIALEIKRARDIALLGYDYSVDGDGRHHFHDEYDWHHIAQDQSWKVWAQSYQATAMACERLRARVVNYSPDSCIEWFKKEKLENLQ